MKRRLIITAFGKTQNLRQWAKERGFRYETLYDRFDRHPDTDPEELLSRPLRKKRGGTRFGLLWNGIAPFKAPCLTVGRYRE